MKITKIALIGLMALSGATYAGTIHDTASNVKDKTLNVASEAKNKSEDFAQSTWSETKRVTRTVVDSPVIAYHVVRGDRPLFNHEPKSRESMALTGHRVRAEKQDSTNHAQQPPI